MSGQNYAKTPFTVIANMESKDTSMESGDKRSLSASASPTRDGILRSGPKHARAYKSPFTTPARSTEVPIEVVSELPAIESFPFNLSESSGQASLSHAASPVQVSVSSPPSIESCRLYGRNGNHDASVTERTR